MPVVTIKHGRKSLLDYQADTWVESTLVLAQQLSNYSLSFGVRVMAKWLDRTYASQRYETKIEEREGTETLTVIYIP